MTNCRIGRVKYKNGFEVIVPQFSDRTDAEKWLHEKIESFESVMKIDGFALVVWDKDGNTMVGYSRGHIHHYDFPQFVADALRDLRDN